MGPGLVYPVQMPRVGDDTLSHTDESDDDINDQIVYRVYTKCCLIKVTDEGMSAFLLSERSTAVYSTARPSTQFICDFYTPEKANTCCCQLAPIYCNCGVSVGYYVLLPCRVCLGNDDNNEHRWVFYAWATTVRERLRSCETTLMQFKYLPVQSWHYAAR